MQEIWVKPRCMGHMQVALQCKRSRGLYGLNLEGGESVASSQFNQADPVFQSLKRDHFGAAHHTNAAGETRFPGNRDIPSETVSRPLRQPPSSPRPPPLRPLDKYYLIRGVSVSFSILGKPPQLTATQQVLRQPLLYGSVQSW